ncbi:MAG: sulfatase-like hydrolase/transferase [Planctomycetes bacterium]|nr:sulfatase-like hydrolase/transferase [Planctomycetota bacterium]
MPIRVRRLLASLMVVAAVGAIGAPWSRGEDESPPARKPNLVFVMSDQHSWDMLACYGNQDVITPNFDRLAGEGVRFDHCISNSPVCTPYRGILMTGQHPLNSGAMQNDLQMLLGEGNYLGQVLRDAGYRMGYFGKWHLYGGNRVRPVPPGPFRYGFDHEFLTNNCTLLYDAKRAYYWDEAGQKQLYGDWESDAQTDQAIAFVEKHADKPFSLFVSWHPPHNWGRDHEGYLAPEDCLKLYDPAKLHLRPNVEDTPANRLKYQGHMAMITSLDRAFGRLMRKLDEKGVTDNTLVVFTSDHGDMLMSYGWPNNKGRAEHGSCRVPLLVRYPGRLKPRTSDLLIGTFDLMPTLLGLLGLPVPDTCQGQNLADAIVNHRDDVVKSQPLFFLPADWRGIYTRRYTYSFTVDPESPHHKSLSDNLLFDRQEDPWETSNLFDSPGHDEIRNKLHQQTLEWMARFGDTGFRFEELIERVVRAEDWPAASLGPRYRPRSWEGRLKGRPVDFLPLKERKAPGRELLRNLTVKPAELVVVEGERLKLSSKPPRAWAEGTKLRRLRPLGPDAGVPAPGAIDPESIVVRHKGRDLKLGADFLADRTYGTLGLAPNASVAAEDEVEVDYRFSLRRIDSIVLAADSRHAVREGTSDLTTPKPPGLKQGDRRLANVLVDYFSDGENVEVFPIEEGPDKAVTFTTSGRVPRTLAKLREGKPVKIVSWGDSVTAGGDASSADTRYTAVFQKRLRAKFPSADVTVETIAVGGSNSRQWLYPDRFPGPQSKQTVWQRIVDAKPDLVTIEFVNDAGMTPQQVDVVYIDILRRLRKIGAEVIFITPHFTRPSMMRMKSLREPDRRPYVHAMRAFADRRDLAVADTSSRWAHLWKEGLPYVTLLRNGINHPDDRGHALFADELMRCFE